MGLGGVLRADGLPCYICGRWAPGGPVHGSRKYRMQFVAPDNPRCGRCAIRRPCAAVCQGRAESSRVGFVWRPYTPHFRAVDLSLPHIVACIRASHIPSPLLILTPLSSMSISILIGCVLIVRICPLLDIYSALSCRPLLCVYLVDVLHPHVKTQSTASPSGILVVCTSVQCPRRLNDCV